MTKWLMTGTALLVAGLLKIWQHTNAPMTLEDYLAFRCGSASGAAGDSFLTFAGHCWGCPVAAVGAAMVAYSAVMVIASSRRQALAVRR